MPDQDSAKRPLRRSRGSKDAAAAITTPGQQLQQETLQGARRASSAKRRNPEPARAMEDVKDAANNGTTSHDAAPKPKRKRKADALEGLLDGNGPITTFSAPPPKSGSDAHKANPSTKSLTYTVQPSLPTVDEYVALRVGSGLSKPPVEADIERAMSGSVYCLVARLPAAKAAKSAKSAKPSKHETETENGTADADTDADGEDDSSAAQTAPVSSSPPQGKAIGMVRLIGDGELMCQLCDMCVLPEVQGRGIGKVLMDQMLAWVDERAPTAYVSLIGDPGPGQALYRSRGFVETAGVGMKRSKWGR